MKKGICFVVPLFNEAKVVQKCLDSLTAAGISWDDVYLTDDGSTDDTLKIVQKMGFPQKNVKRAVKNSGKATAHSSAFERFDLKNRYEWLNFMDADSFIDANYAKRLMELTTLASEDTLALCSRVKTKKGVYSIPTGYRVGEYFITHWIYKEAQSSLNMVTVLPGCGSCYRTEAVASLFENTDNPTITEDMDWTIHTHLTGKGRIVYDRDLVVYTQDPNTVSGYLKQTNRWTQGCWQVYLKRKMWRFWQHRANAELSFLLLEGLVFSIGMLIVPFYAMAQGPSYALDYLLIDAAVFGCLHSLAAICERDIRPLLYLPTSYMLRVANCLVFLKGFVQIVLLESDKKKSLFWNKVERY